MRALDGDLAGAESIQQELVDRSKASFVNPAALAVAAAAAGHLETARRVLAEAIAAHDAYLNFHKLPVWQPIWNDPECAAILRGSELILNAPR